MLLIGLISVSLITLFLVFNSTDQIGKLRLEVRKMRGEVAELKSMMLTGENAPDVEEVEEKVLE
jgi:hypothetical protein